MKHTIYYNVQNGGDGSAYPRFFDSERLAAFDEAQMTDSWGEPSVGSLTLSSDSPISVDDFRVMTNASYLVEMWENDDAAIGDFIREFFAGGLPAFAVIDADSKTFYREVVITANGEPVASMFTSKSAQSITEALNALR